MAPPAPPRSLAVYEPSGRASRRAALKLAALVDVVALRVSVKGCTRIKIHWWFCEKMRYANG